MIVIALNKRMPSDYTASPRVHLGAEFEIDVAAFDEERTVAPQIGTETSAGAAVATWAPPKPTLAVDVDLHEQDEYEVRVHNRNNRLV